MAAPTVYGYNGMTLVGTKKGWSKGDGETVIESWEGPKTQADAFYLSQMLDPAVTTLSLDPDGPKVRVDVTKPDPDLQTTEIDNATWTLRKTTVMKDIRSHPYFTQSTVLASDIARCDKAIENGTLYDFASAGIPNVMKRYFALREAGVESYPDYALVIRKTIIVSAQSSITLSYTGANTVVTLDSIDPPTALIGALTALPKVSYNGADPVTNRQETTGDWEWLKEVPECQSNGKNKFQLVYEWTGVEKWSTVIYKGSWDPMAP